MGCRFVVPWADASSFDIDYPLLEFIFSRPATWCAPVVEMPNILPYTWSHFCPYTTNVTFLPQILVWWFWLSYRSLWFNAPLWCHVDVLRMVPPYSRLDVCFTVHLLLGPPFNWIAYLCRFRERPRSTLAVPISPLWNIQLQLSSIVSGVWANFDGRCKRHIHLFGSWCGQYWSDNKFGPATLGASWSPVALRQRRLVVIPSMQLCHLSSHLP